MSITKRVRDYSKNSPRTKLADGFYAYQRPEYKSWDLMLQRCYTPKNPSFAKYGLKGVRVCSRWKKFLNFYEDMGDKPTPQHTLDRIDNDKGYSPTNCRWATKQEQVLNRGLTKRNTSGFRGVYWNNQANKWHAQIHSYNTRRNISLGYYDDPEQAALAYDCAVMQLRETLTGLNILSFEG